eukprot:Polyplicarium_translucidae@DN5500_c0_g1_i1.p1
MSTYRLRLSSSSVPVTLPSPDTPHRATSFLIPPHHFLAEMKADMDCAIAEMEKHVNAMMQKEASAPLASVLTPSVIARSPVSGNAIALLESPDPDFKTFETFGELPLHPKLLQKVAELDLRKPTKLQRMLLPQLLARRNILGFCGRGDGKSISILTAAVEWASRSLRDQQDEADAAPFQTLIVCASTPRAFDLQQRVLLLAAALPISCAMLEKSADSAADLPTQPASHIAILGQPQDCDAIVGRGGMRVATVIVDDLEDILAVSEDFESFLAELGSGAARQQLVVFSKEPLQSTKPWSVMEKRAATDFVCVHV